MNETPQVSVIVPTYNREAWLAPTLQSIVSQSIPPVEVFVVDDGSTDGSAAAFASFAAAHAGRPTRLHYIRQENKGKSTAINHALEKVTCEWIAFDDSDDLWANNKLELQFAAVRKHPDAGACFTDARFTNNPSMQTTAFQRARKTFPHESGIIADPALYVLSPPHGIFMQTMVARRALVTSIGGFDPRFLVSQDTDFIYRLACVTKFCYVNQALVDIDRTQERTLGLTTNFGRTSLRRLETLEAIFEKWIGLTSRADLRKKIRRQLAGVRVEQASLHLAHNERRLALRMTRKSLRAQISIKSLVRYGVLTVCPALLKRTVTRPQT